MADPRSRKGALNELHNRSVWESVRTYRCTWITKESGLESQRHKPLTREQV